jgi:hypothetical protein
MKTLIRENPTIAFGLGLPLVLVVVLLLISGLPSLLVPSPQYNILYATGYYNYQHGMQIAVVDDKIRVLYYNSLQLPIGKPKLWRFDPKTGALKEIPIELPTSLSGTGKTPTTGEEVPKRAQIAVPDLEGLIIDSSNIAPDGYKFSVVKDRYSGDVFGSFFYSSRYTHDAVLTKNGRTIRLPNTAKDSYDSRAHFIGWVVSP